MFSAALFTIAKTWNQPKCPSMIDWAHRKCGKERKMWKERKCGRYTPWNTM